MYRKIISIILVLVMITGILNIAQFSTLAVSDNQLNNLSDDSITVYFINNHKWEKVYIYTWEPELFEWPGTSMSFVGVDKSGYDIYSAEISKDTEGIVFNNYTGTKTIDITTGIEHNSGWYISDDSSVLVPHSVKEFIYKGVSDTSYLDPEDIPIEEEDEKVLSVYFINTPKWKDVYIYSWYSDLSEPFEWPGTKMIYLYQDENGDDVYKAEITSDTYGVIFSCGDSESKTVDITTGIENDTVWYTTDVKSGIYNVESVKCSDLYKTEGDYTYLIKNENEVIIVQYTGTDAKVEVPEKINNYIVSEISTEAFTDNINLVNLVLPDSIKTIGYHAFYNCKMLSSIKFSNNLESIGTSAFENCLSLKSIEVPASLKKDGIVALNNSIGTPFKNCSLLKTVVFEEGTVTIPDNILNGAENVNSIVIPEGTKTIGESAFKGCEGIVTIDFPDSLISIEGRAFEGCYSLLLDSLPENVESLAYYSFKDCIGINSIIIPKTLVSVNIKDNYYAPFYGCINLKEAVFEDGSTVIANHILESVESLEKVTIPDTVTIINQASFHGCFKLKEVSLPNGIVSIGSRAFKDCNKLEEIKLPDNLEKIGYLAFKNCSGLKSITIPKNTTEVTFEDEGLYSVFDNCNKLTEVVFEEGSTMVADHICENMTALERVVIPDTVTSIGVSAFHNCRNLKEVTIPKNVESIGTSAFRYCQKLSEITFPEKLKTLGERAFEYCTSLSTISFNGYVDDISSDAFKDCNPMVVYCPKYSKTTIFFIDNGNFSISNDDVRRVANTVVDDSKSYYTIKSGRRLSAEIKYSLDNDVYKSITNAYLKIYVPTGMNVVDELLYMDKEICTEYTFDGHYICVPVKNQEGKLSLDFEFSSDFNLMTYATLHYTFNGKEDYEIIDIINESYDVIALYTEDIVPDGKVDLSGYAPAGSFVEVYLDDELVTTLKANKVGMFSGEITLENPENEDIYIITVKTTSNEKQLSASQKIKYIKDAPKLTVFDMYYNGGVYDLMAKNKQHVNFRLEEYHGVTPFKFNVEFNNREQIDKVYISSTRNQITKTVEAEWSEFEQAYVFNGYFDDADHDYVPGNLTVNYSPVKKDFYFEDEIDYSSKKYTNNLSEPIKNAISGNVYDCIENLQQDEKTTSGKIKLEEINTEFDFDISINSIPSYLTPQNAEEYGYQKYTDDAGSSLYMKNLEGYDDVIRCEIIDFVKDDIVDFLIDADFIDAGIALESVFSFGDILGYGETLVTWDNNQRDIKEMKHAIMTSNMTELEKEEALDKLDMAKKANNATVAIMALEIILFAAGVTIPFPASMVLPLLSHHNSMLVDSALGKYSYLNSGLVSSPNFRIMWNIDPSGYVYSGKPENRIPGAKVTAYWIPYDENDLDFWENPDESKAIIWDASEYGQINPLITDNDGKYSWDVPEGWWQVKCEKEEYVTTYSEWLPVPPPQMDVNLNLVSIYETTVTEPTEDVITTTLQSEPAETETKDSLATDPVESKPNTENTKPVVTDPAESTVPMNPASPTKPSESINTKPVITTETSTGEDTNSSVPVVDKGILGDVNGDGKINIKDATMIQKAAAKIIELTDDEKLRADVNADNKNNVKDATAIQKFVAKIETGFDIGKIIGV